VNKRTQKELEEAEVLSLFMKWREMFKKLRISMRGGKADRGENSGK
jgi:hypothetical protein